MALWDIMENEPVKAFEAFQMYLQAGYHRSYRDVSAALGLSGTSLANYSTDWHWVARVKAWEQNRAAELAEASLALALTNQEVIVTDAMNNYQRLMTLWQTQLAKYEEVSKNDEFIDTESFKRLASTVKDIDDMGRRASGLPNIIRQLDDDKTRLPRKKQLQLVGGLKTDTVFDEA